MTQQEYYTALFKWLVFYSAGAALVFATIAACVLVFLYARYFR